MLGWQGVKMEAVEALYLCNSSSYYLTCLAICSNSCRSFCAWSLLHLVRHRLSCSIKREKRAFYLCNFFFFVFKVHTKMGEEIRINYFHFMRHGPDYYINCYSGGPIWIMSWNYRCFSW
jgi:hypothetical protein